MFEIMPYNRRRSEIYDPFKALERSFFGGGFYDNSLNRIRTDVKTTDKGYLVEAELPGFSRDDISIELDGDYLTVKAESKSESEDRSDSGYLRRERRYGSFSRSFDVSEIDTDSITASYENGLLKLDLPKKADQQTSARKIEIK